MSSRNSSSSLSKDARRLLPLDSRYLFAILAGYGLCLADLGDPEAAGVLEETRQVGSASVGKDDPKLAEVTGALARLQGGE